MRILLAFLPALLGACALTNVPIRLPARTDTGLTGGDGREIIVVRPFRDERQQRDRCGMQKNSYGWDMASAVCSEDPAAWIATLLATELRAVGFSVVEQPTRPASVRVEGTLLKVFIEPVIGFTTVGLETDLQAGLLVTSPTGLEAERRFFAKGTASSIAATASTFQSSADDAARRIVKDMVTAILTLMNRYPELGLWRRPGAAAVEVWG